MVDSKKLLAQVKALPNWLSIALDSAYKSRWKAKKKGDSRALASADRNIARLRSKAGL